MKKIFISVMVMLMVGSVVGCSKDEALKTYNNIIKTIGNRQLTDDDKLVGHRDFGNDEYVGTYNAKYKNYSGKECLFGGISIKRKDGNKIKVKCKITTDSGQGKVSIMSGNDKEEVLIDDGEVYEKTLDILEGSIYILIECDKFSGKVQIISE